MATDDVASFLSAQLDDEQKWWDSEPPDRTGAKDRALREIAAKRATLVEYVAAQERFERTLPGNYHEHNSVASAWEQAVRITAAVYADRRGYRQYWAPIPPISTPSSTTPAAPSR